MTGGRNTPASTRLHYPEADKPHISTGHCGPAGHATRGRNGQRMTWLTVGSSASLAAVAAGCGKR